MINTVSLNNINFALNKSFVLIAGPCVIEDEDMIFSTAEFLKELTKRLD
ncbi:DAHP synthetase I/KDSA domain protein, partial [Candidatus Magnetomorum sp. HK-1]